MLAFFPREIGTVRLAPRHDAPAVRRQPPFLPRASVAWQSISRGNFAKCFRRVFPVMMTAFAKIAVFKASVTGVTVAGSPAETLAGKSEIR